MAKNVFKLRVWEIQSHTHDLYGSPIFTEDIIEKYIKSKGDAIMRWAWCLHDQDTYTLQEERNSAEHNNGVATVHAGDKKPNHIHLMIEFSNQTYNSAIAKDFGLPIGLVQKPRCDDKKKQFDAMVTYLTHEMDDQQAIGKHLYADSEIHANFNFRTVIDKYKSIKTKSLAKRMQKTEVSELIEAVARGEISISDLKREYGFAFFLDYEQKFLKARQEYLKKHYQMLPRINYYIDGPSGRGKTTLAEMLARSLVPELSEDEAYYEVGNAGVRFDNYEHQPIIIWDDIRAGNLIAEFGREGVLNLLELHPKKRNYNIKYGGVILTNQVNIFTGKDSFEKFLDGLAGEYKDKDGNQYDSEMNAKEQTYRRVPIIIHLHPADIEVLLNRGVFEGTDEYLEYRLWSHMKANVLSANMHFASSVKLEMGQKLLAPVVDKHMEYMEAQGDWNKVDDPSAIPDFEIAVGYDAVAKMKKKDLADYKIFKQRWKEKHAERLAKLAEESSGRYSVDEIAEQRIITFDDWYERGRPMTADLEYVDTYKEIAEAALEKKHEKWLDEAFEYAEARDMEKIEALLAEDEAKTMAQVDYYIYVLEIKEVAERFEKEPTLNNFTKCLEKLSEDYHSVVNEPATQQIASVAVAHGYMSATTDLWQYINENFGLK